MDGFSGTKCGTGLQKKWWGDKEPSDKSSIWYKGGCPFVYDASTKSWVPQSTSGGGGGSLTGLALLKAFIDATVSPNTTLTDDTIIGFNVPTYTYKYENSAAITAVSDKFTYFDSNNCVVAVFDVEKSIFMPISCPSESGSLYDSKYNFLNIAQGVSNLDVLDKSSRTEPVNRILILRNSNKGESGGGFMWDWNNSVPLYITSNFDKSTYVYYGDLK